MDAAKWPSWSQRRPDQGFEGSDKIFRPLPHRPLPMTCGTGSDVSQFAVITDTERRCKMTIAGRCIAPTSASPTDTLATLPDEYVCCRYGCAQSPWAFFRGLYLADRCPCHQGPAPPFESLVKRCGNATR
jgi:hypothetical protein